MFSSTRYRCSSVFICGSLVQIALGFHQLCVENRSAGRAANRIMREHYKSNVEDRTLANASDDRAHPIARVAIEPRLRAILLVSHNHRARWSGRQLQSLRKGFELG